MAATLPAYQVMVQELVPREQVRAVASLGGVAVNGARAVGPALAGALLAQVGATLVFAVTAVAALAFVLALTVTRRPPRDAALPPERFASAMRAGGRYVRNSPVVRRMLLRVVLFVLPGAAIWALLPVVADELLRTSSTGYGLLLGSLGVGAVLGAALLPLVAGRLSPNQLLVVSGGLFAASLLACVLVTDLLVLARAACARRDGLAGRPDGHHRGAAGVPARLGARPRPVDVQRRLRRRRRPPVRCCGGWSRSGPGWSRRSSPRPS